jgi:hypothetical protein
MEHLTKQKLTAEGIMSALLSQDRRYSKKFCVSVFMGPRWSVTVNLALERSRSVWAKERILTLKKENTATHC